MKSIKFFVFLSLLFFTQVSWGQKKVWVKFGDESMELSDAYAASKFYEKALAYDTADLALTYKYMKSLMAYQNYEKALDLALNLRSKVELSEFPDIDYEIGVIRKHLGCYDCAEAYFQKYIKQASAGQNYRLKAQNEVKNYQRVKDLLKDTLEMDFSALPGEVNTGASEFASVLLNDSVLYFSSLRTSSLLEDGIIKQGEYHAGIYKAEKKDSAWKVAGQLKYKGKEISLANGSFTSDKSIFYFTSCEQFRNCKIYKGNIKGDSLVNVEVLPEPINAAGTETTHPHIVETDNKTWLFFSSNRLGGIGGMDLWVSEYKGSWKVAKNLGKSINTEGDELSPFYVAEDSAFYFASNWHYNLGGFDIFKSTGVFPSKWSEPINLGIPINSRLNDLYYTPSSPYKGYLTSSRPGSITEKDAPCCNDLYRYEIPKPKELLADTVQPLLLSLIHQQPVVYFHNDRPNEDSWDTLTDLNYQTTYDRYTPRYQEYKKEFSSQFKEAKVAWAQAAVDTFFNDYLFKGYQDLVRFSNELITALEQGISVEVDLHGFASPLTKSNYNVNLSLRRISSIMNFLQAYDNGKLVPFINGTAENGAKLTFKKIPNGEYKAKEGVSDNYYDVRNSIYNPNAALERKVELKAVLVQYDSLPIWSLSNQEMELKINKDQQEAAIYLLNDALDSLIVENHFYQHQGLQGFGNEIAVRLVKGAVYLLKFTVDSSIHNPTLIVVINGEERRLRISIK